jgi:hypothetical protein
VVLARRFVIRERRGVFREARGHQLYA